MNTEKEKPVLLLIDDNKRMIVTLSDFLAYEGFDVKTAKSGGEVVKSAATIKPDVIVLKDILPGMNGRVIVPLLRAMPSTKNTPIILYDDTRSIEDESRYGRRIPDGVSEYLNTSEASDITDAVRKHIK
jgi:CheY-like chemotaxis protein